MRKRRINVSDHVQGSIVCEYLDGKPARTIAREFGVSHQTAYNQLRAAGIEIRGRGYRSPEPFNPESPA